MACQVWTGIDCCFHWYYIELMSNKFLTIQEVADYLRVSKKTIYRYIESKRLKVLKLTDQHFRIDGKDLNSFIKKHKK